MATLGYADLKDTKAHSLWDMDEMKRVALADGRTFDEMLGELQAALNIVNSDFADDAYYAGMLSVQDDAEVETDTDSGGEDFIKKITDHSKLDASKGMTTGWTLPLDDFGGALGWSLLGLQRRTSRQLQADLKVAINGIKKNFEKTTLARFFKMEAEAVGATSGASVPFCDGGTADSNFVPPPYDGEEFLSTHDHFLRLDGISNANGAAAIAHLREHGHMGPYILTVADADKSSWTALTKFHPPKWDNVDWMQNTGPRAGFSQDDTFIGIFETDDGIAYVRSTARVPTGYYGAHKAYGKLDERNAMRMRLDPNFGYGFQIVPGNWVNAPHLLAVVIAQYGIGVGDRTNGVCVENDSAGDYATPSIS